ncbi:MULTISPECIES: branched-chain amino acid ABC transporter permease [unclassified Polynucleobacter]|jgi:branched-chain amino acid transport system permease protein|uniref:branched-chain amino acid ABC transporter permease n=1 Tax=unclassified Polynucleobacter TaxID=2640945 RepID=UPI001C0E85D2|nr:MULTISPECIES: branched-chain amino acid ABC transporter permease [unclassified Polynucleobacter]MBU3564232.1 branched-chain amino acid ABC transporter permease [Polynucleobacter sp. Tro8-14-1]MBU3642003.1 branched-chain amino acid ABC transporter permease [Polynucleobacter sp. Fuers-14]MEA9568987.1 branched-chain amino acid ABC transporter permease [Polynucleobacter sp. AP-Nickl1-40-C4]
MSFDIFLQYLLNGLMLGVIYAIVAVGFTLYFGVLDVIKFSHGDILMVGAFAGLTAYIGIAETFTSPWLQLLVLIVVSLAVAAFLGAVIARYLILPLQKAPPINTLLVTLMLGLALRELVRLFYPNGSNPKPFPKLLPVDGIALGEFTLRSDSLILLITGVLIIIAVQRLITKSKIGLAIRAVAQDSETARIMGINFHRIVLITFMLGSALAALAGLMNGLYYNEVNFSMGLLLGVIGFSAAVVGGLGNFYGAIVGGFLFAGLQTIGAVLLPAIMPSVPSAYKDVFAFAVIIIIMGLKPTGLISEKSSERV